MEGFGAFLGQEWESLNRMISVEDPDDQLFLNNDEISSIIWSTNVENVQGGVSDQSLYFPSAFTDQDHVLDTNLYNSISQECSNSSTQDNYGVNFVNNVTNDTFDESINFCQNDNLPVPVFSDDMMQEILQLKTELHNEQMISSPEVETQNKRKYEANSSQGSKKRSRVSKEAPKNKKKAQSTKNKKNSIDNEEDNNIASACSSEDESKDSESLNSKGKARASRGSATDPQSLYARRRRERINERLRILQNLVPNGTKVDISTMLEEAVHYVKFLQLQIKLLSSDDMWMYAPIAHNGMDMGLYQNLISNLMPQI